LCLKRSYFGLLRISKRIRNKECMSEIGAVLGIRL